MNIKVRMGGKRRREGKMEKAASTIEVDFRSRARNPQYPLVKTEACKVFELAF
jgi:hypothetical protein